MNGPVHNPELGEIEPGLDEVSEVVVQAFESLPTTFREQWELFGDLSPDELTQRIREDFADQPRERREILIAYLGRRLGYRRYLHTTAKLRIQPLWDLLHRETFERLSAGDREVLWMIACTTQRIRQTLHPKAALATLALWRFGTPDEQERAERLLTTLGLPTRMHDLYDLVRALARKQSEEEVGAERDLFSLARCHLDAGMSDVAALIAGLFLVHRFDPWYTGAPRINLERACDRAAQEFPFRYQDWLMLLAEAAVTGELTSSWLERPVEAVIRLTIGDGDLNARYRAFHARKLYEGGRERLRALYEPWLSQLGPGNGAALPYLLREVDRTSGENPFRAMRLMELIVSRAGARPLPHLLRGLAELDPITERLLVLYVQCFHLDPVAVRFVRQHHEGVDWTQHVPLGPDDVKRFLLVGDYEATFGARDVDLLGVPIVHLDKDAAARVRYFHTSRGNPNSLVALLQDFDLPGALPVSRIAESSFVKSLTSDFVQVFEERAGQRDLREQVLHDLHAVGAQVQSWEEIGQLPVIKIEQALLRGRQRDLVVGAVAGAAAGAFAPRTAGVSAIMDVPFIMGLVADTCARHCWYYGFDPRDNADLARQIIAVALGGVSSADMTDAEVRRALQGYLTRRSIVMAAIGQGAVAQIAGPTVGMIWDHVGQLGRRPPLMVAALERVARRDQRPAFTRRMVKYFLPVVDGFLGAAFNVSLVYDLGESAQAVLADRFLARKYRLWESRF